MNRIVFIICFLCVQYLANAQYIFSDVVINPCSTVKSQDNTGTCWCFATSSFLESEIIHQGKKPVDISEMYLVKTIYKDKALNYILRQGKANFSQGGLAHDVFRAIDIAGLMPEESYSGLIEGKKYDHNELESALKGFLDGVIKANKPSKYWSGAVDGILNAYMGISSQRFNYDGKTMSPEKFAKELDINSSNYIELTSFTHHPFYKSFILEVPDNYSNGSFYNVPLDDLMNTIDYALANGYTISWDGDVSNANFSGKESIAIIPEDQDRKDKFTLPGKEKKITQEDRQAAFENYATTDDHLMHLVGSGKDQNGTKYYIVKNSWGEIGKQNGYIYLSESYVRLSTIGILFNKKALLPSLSSQLQL